MKLSREVRKRLSIASTMEELQECALSVHISGQIGFPVRLVPFGYGERMKEVVVFDSVQLKRVGKEILDPEYSCFGYVHVFKEYVRTVISLPIKQS